MGFCVLDANGCVKARPSGSGASLADPLPVANGGLLITTFPKCGILYGPAADTYLARVPDLDNGVAVPKLFDNLLFPGETAASDPRLGLVPRWTSTRYFSNLVGGGIGRPGGWQSNGARPSFAEVLMSTTLSQTGGVANTAASVSQDATANWARYETGAAGSAVGTGYITNGYCRVGHQPFVEIKMRTGSSVSGIRYWFILSDQTASVSGNDDQSALSGAGLRYSSGAGDTGWMIWSANGTTQSIGAQVAAIAASTVYTLTFSVSSAQAMTLTIQQGSTVSQAIVNFPPGKDLTNLVPQFGVSNSSGAGTRFFDLTASYLTMQATLASA